MVGYPSLLREKALSIGCVSDRALTLRALWADLGGGD